MAKEVMASNFEVHGNFASDLLKGQLFNFTTIVRSIKRVELMADEEETLSLPEGCMVN